MATKEYLWGHTKRYNDYSTHFKSKFVERVQKISIDAGFTCPNRDGHKGRGGCTYCNNNTFNPYYCSPKKSVSEQLNEGIAFFSQKYKSQKYLCYFQAYSNTYGSFEHLKNIWNEALAHPKVIGLVIGTRPDCIDNKVLDYLAHLSEKYYIVLEFGIESTLDRTLNLVNRCHTYSDSVNAINEATKRGIEVGVHIILGLPEESEKELLEHADKISLLPITSVKLHHLQIIKHTAMSNDYFKNPHKYNLFSLESYINFITEFLQRLNPRIVVERFISESPSDLLIAPKWGGLKNFEIIHKIEKKLEIENAWQGKKFKTANLR